ncbi:MAG: hypothetical protein ACHQEB_05230 [Chitinophagales bacterium]
MQSTVMRKSHLLSVLSLFLLVPASITWAQTITSQKGLTTAVFNTSSGTIKVYLPDDIRPGDVISGQVIAEPVGKNAKQLEKNLADLKKYSVSFSNEKFSIGTADDPFKFSTHIDKPLQGQMELLNATGTKVQELPVSSIPANEQKPTPAECIIPTHALTGTPLSISGPFDGNASNTTCSSDNKPVEVLAESPRECIISYPADAGGLHTLQVQENGKTPCSQKVSGVNMNVSAGKLNLQKGETTYIDVSITGLQNLPDTAVLSLVNITTDVVMMLPSNAVVIPLSPDSVGTGTFNRRFNIQSTKTGSFIVNVNLDLPDNYYTTPASETTQPPQPVTRHCECSVSVGLQKTSESGNDFSFKAVVNAECKGAYGTGYSTFIKCSVKSISYQWSIIDGNENAAISGAANTDKVAVKAKNNNSFTVMVKVTVVCADGTICVKEAAMHRSGAPVTGPITQPPPTENPPTTTNPPPEKVKCGCECSVTAKLTRIDPKNGVIGFKVTDVKGECKLKPCPGAGTQAQCSLVNVTYSWSIGSGKDVASINGAANKAEVSVSFTGTGAYTVNVTVTAHCSDGTSCSIVLSAEEYIPPTTTTKACNISKEELVEPKMDGGLKEKYKGTKTIRRDDFIALGAEGRDFDQLRWMCNPYNCPDTKSEKIVPLNSRVKFTWDITTTDESGFVKLGCLPDNVKSDEGDNVIFRPPVVPLPVKASDTSVTTLITLSVIDDNPTQPIDPTVKRIITIITKRSKSNPDFYTVEIKSDKYTLPSAPAAKLLDGTCKATGPAWSMTDDLTKPVIELPGVPDNNKMVLGQWIVLTANDQRDNDKCTIICVSAGQCPTSPIDKIYEDNVAWDWTVTGGGKFISDPTGRFIIYEAPLDLPKGKDFVDVTFKVKVKNPDGMKISDKLPPEGEITIRVYQPGVKLSEVPLDWLPEEDNNVEMKSELMYKDGDWKPALAHMCRIHFFELLDVSTEKGVCLNSPVPKDAYDCRDLKLKNEDKHEAFDDKKAAGKCDQKEMYLQARTQRPEKEYTLKVYSLDFGSYGFLRSFANVNKGGRDSIRGEKPVYISIPVKASDVRHPQGRPKKTVYGDDRVTIPFDIDENHIADNGWTTAGGVAVPDPRNNNVDEDDKPTGDKFKGDGLTTYEEYRGFKVSTKKGDIHIRTNYEVKDVFVRNENNLDIGLYTSLSELDVHEISEPQYIDDNKRVINFNFNKATHLVDQMGLHLVDKGSSAALLGIAFSRTGQPTIPNWETEIRIYTTNIKSLCKRLKLDENKKLAAVVAHELLHGNNVCHHGEGDPDVEKAFDLVHGLRSGNIDCVMRYDNIGIALSKNPEAIGSILCESAAGTGYNANGQHFQDAARNRGNCKGQIRISAVGGLPKSCGNR